MASARTVTLKPEPGSIAFNPKTLSLVPGKALPLGRATTENAATNTNGYFHFDSLNAPVSRAQAEIWCEEGKVYIKDTKSSNGTFLNGVKLDENIATHLTSGDVLTLGIFIEEDASHPLPGESKTPVIAKISF